MAKTENEIKTMLAIQREFCWQRFHGVFYKMLSEMDFDTKEKIKRCITGATSPQQATNYKSE